MNTTKQTKPYYITVVRHFSMGHGDDPQDFLSEKFAEFNEEVNEKVKEGYRPHGSFSMDHCDVASMDLVQAMTQNA